jgi:hypothetical protein
VETVVARRKQCQTHRRLFSPRVLVVASSMVFVATECLGENDGVESSFAATLCIVIAHWTKGEPFQLMASFSRRHNQRTIEIPQKDNGCSLSIMVCVKWVRESLGKLANSPKHSLSAVRPKHVLCAITTVWTGGTGRRFGKRDAAVVVDTARQEFLDFACLTRDGLCWLVRNLYIPRNTFIKSAWKLISIIPKIHFLLKWWCFGRGR